MIIINRTDKSIVGSIKGKPFSVPFNENTYKSLKALEAEVKTLSTQSEIKPIIEKATLLTTVDFGTVVASTNPYLSYNPAKDLYFLTIGKGTPNEHIDDRAIPGPIAETIMEQFEKGYDFMPMIKAWARFLQRDKAYSEEDARYFGTYITSRYVDDELAQKLVEEEGINYDVAYERATFNDMAITQEGLLATYKVVEEVTTEWALEKDDKGEVVLDSQGNPKKIKVLKAEYRKQYDIDPLTGETKVTEGKPAFLEDRMFTPAIHKNGENFMSGAKLGYIYKVGEPQYLPKTNPVTGKPAIINHNNTFGGGGLYTGGLQYIKSYRKDDTPVLVCFLDPANIISFQAEGAAIRTWELFPHNILEDDTELKGVYHSSAYAKESADKTKARIEEIINKRIEELNKHHNDQSKLANLIEE